MKFIERYFIFCQPETFFAQHFLGVGFPSSTSGLGCFKSMSWWNSPQQTKWRKHMGISPWQLLTKKIKQFWMFFSSWPTFHNQLQNPKRNLYIFLPSSHTFLSRFKIHYNHAFLPLLHESFPCKHHWQQTNLQFFFGPFRVMFTIPRQRRITTSCFLYVFTALNHSHDGLTENPTEICWFDFEGPHQKIVFNNGDLLKNHGLKTSPKNLPQNFWEIMAIPTKKPSPSSFMFFSSRRHLKHEASEGGRGLRTPSKNPNEI